MRDAWEQARRSPGQWVGTRVLRRIDAGGVRWTIRKPVARTLTPTPPNRYALVCEYRQHRLASWHSSIDDAKAHRDDLSISWSSRTMGEYAQRLSPGVDQ